MVRTVAGLISRNGPGARLAILVAAVFMLSPLLIRSQSKPQSAWTPSVVPAAQCGPGDRPESGLQGQTTLAERFSAKASQAYNCNLELLGQFPGEGADMDATALDSCGYVATSLGGTGQQHPGVVVVDASDRRRPQATVYLDSAAMLRPNEGLEAHPGRKLLAAIEVSPTAPAAFDVYDAAD